MSKIQRSSWRLLTIIGIGSIASLAPISFQSTVSAATPTEKLPTAPPIPVVPSSIQEINLANILNGTAVPTSIRLREIPADWRAFGINGPVEIGNLQTVINSSAGGSFGASYYTKGQSITIGTETYVVAYSLLSVIETITPDTPLGLSLLNLRTIGSLSNIRAFEIAKETKILAKQLAILKFANIFDPTAEPKAPPPEIDPPRKKPVKKRPNSRRRR
jgi:hypothetical protein